MADWDSMFDGRLEAAGGLDESQLDKVPPRRGVVLLSGRARPIVLITAANMRARVRTRLDRPADEKRRKVVNLREVTRRVWWKFAASAFEADLCLVELARAIWPQTYSSMVGWKPAWFVHVNRDGRFPYFVRGRKFPPPPARSLGPFFRGRDAAEFISSLHDTFDLCRDYQSLRRSPKAHRCSYGQMGRCLCPCDGTISMAEYSAAVGRAADFAAGNRRGLAEELRRRMQAAAERLEFERAAGLQARLRRLADFDRPAYAHVRPVEEFRFLVIQRGRGRREVRVFLCDRGAMGVAAALKYPPAAADLRAVLDEMALYVSSGPAQDEAAALRMGLVSNYLFSGKARRGLIVRWTEDLDGGELGERIAAAGDVLGLGGSAGGG